MGDRHGDGLEREAGAAVLDQEGGDAFAAERGIGAGEDDVVLGDGDVGDGTYLAFEDPFAPLLFALVWREATSLPASGSVRPKPVMRVPRRTPGR